MGEETKRAPKYQLMSGDKVLFTGSYEACKQEWQRRYEQAQKQFHDRNAELQRRWEERGARDDER